MTESKVLIGGPVRVLAVMLTVAMTSCTSPTSLTAPSAPPDSGDLVTASASSRSSLEEATQAEADESQLDILRKGEVSFADYEAALGRTFVCLRGNGIDVMEQGISDARGFPLIEYSWAATAPGLSDDQVRALGDDCERRFSYWVNMEWQIQPSSIELAEKTFVPYRSAVVECLRKHGVTVTDDVTRWDAVDLAMEVLDRNGMGTGVDCFVEAGIRM